MTKIRKSVPRGPRSWESEQRRDRHLRRRRQIHCTPPKTDSTRSIMRQRAANIAKTNPGMKAADGWLHGLGVPLEYVEALFEHIPQIIGFIVFGIAPLVILGCVIRCSWTHRHRILNCCGCRKQPNIQQHLEPVLKPNIKPKNSGVRFPASTKTEQELL
jgi:hypothetical protein